MAPGLTSESSRLLGASGTNTILTHVWCHRWEEAASSALQLLSRLHTHGVTEEECGLVQTVALKQAIARADEVRSFSFSTVCGLQRWDSRQPLRQDDEAQVCTPRDLMAAIATGSVVMTPLQHSQACHMALTTITVEVG